MPRSRVRSHHVVVFVCAATGADALVVAVCSAAIGARCTIAAFLDQEASHAFECVIVAMPCRKNDVHFTRKDYMSFSTRPYVTLLTTYLGPQRRRAALLAVLLIGSIGLQLLNPQVIRFFIDTAQAGRTDSALLLAAAVFIVAGLVQRAIAFGALYVGENVAWAATNALRADLARHCLRLDMAFHKTHTPGELIERIDGDVSALDDFLSQFTIRLLG